MTYKSYSKIRLATVNVGSETLDLVCGAPNVAVGQKVPVALLGAKMAGGMEIKKVKIRGVESCGMICSETELGISDDHSGILVLDPEATIGQPLVEPLDYDDYILVFELTPNRGDSMCWSAKVSVTVAVSENSRKRCRSIIELLPHSIRIQTRAFRI